MLSQKTFINALTLVTVQYSGIIKMDNLTKKQRSYCMSQIKRADTKAELLFRRYIWGKNIKDYRLLGKKVNINQ